MLAGQSQVENIILFSLEKSQNRKRRIPVTKQLLQKQVSLFCFPLRGDQLFNEKEDQCQSYL